MHIFFKLNTAEMKKNILQEIIHYKLYIIKLKKWKVEEVNECHLKAKAHMVIGWVS